jgi:hypothetical protein|tara:strand:- start:89 stop:283 length:195 start_codon:yes stop_codon:yes gene_type:complete
MKTFTARDLNEKRQEIREAIQDGGCIIEFKRLDRTVELKALMIPYEDYAGSFPRSASIKSIVFE